MKFSASAITIFALLPTLTYSTKPKAMKATVSYTPKYDNKKDSLDSVSCSDGTYGLMSQGYSNFGSLPNFPYIGGGPSVTWDSTKCGTCWKLTYGKRSINVLLVDNGNTGFNIGKKAMDDLTDGHAVELGKVVVTSKQIASSNCGL